MAAVTVTAGFCAAKAAANTSMPLITPFSRAVRWAEPVSSGGDGGLAGDVAVGRVFGERRFDGDADDV